MGREDKNKLGCGTFLLVLLLAYWVCRAYIAEGELAMAETPMPKRR